jgi:hypothetical protein
MCDLEVHLAERLMRRGLILVKAAYDADTAVWFVESSDLEGVNAEAPSLEELLHMTCSPSVPHRP